MAIPERKGGGAGKLVFFTLLVLVVGIGYLVYSQFGPDGGGDGNGNGGNGSGPQATGPGTAGSGGPAGHSTGSPPPAGERVEFRIAYGTEKRLWLEWAAREFEKTAAGRRIRPILYGRGSVEGAQDVVNGPGDKPIHVWSPASSAYRDVFETEWKIRHGAGSPILRSDNLALTPMVFVGWKQRLDAYRAKYPQVDFRSVAEAMHAESGWDTIAGKPEWGHFKFGHTDPSKSNSGLLALVLMAYDYAGKERGLEVRDIMTAEFQQWLARFERGVARPGGSLTHSTGTLMKEMILRGPSQFDVLMVYENLAIDYLKAAQGRWGELFVVYPERNMWNEHPLLHPGRALELGEASRRGRRVPRLPDERARSSARPCSTASVPATRWCRSSSTRARSSATRITA
jgi:hypothetical protein